MAYVLSSLDLMWWNHLGTCYCYNSLKEPTKFKRMSCLCCHQSCKCLLLGVGCGDWRGNLLPFVYSWDSDVLGAAFECSNMVWMFQYGSQCLINHAFIKTWNSLVVSVAKLDQLSSVCLNSLSHSLSVPGVLILALPLFFTLKCPRS